MSEDSTLKKKNEVFHRGNRACEFWKVEYYLEGNLSPNMGHWGGFWLVILSSDSSWVKVFF